MNFFKKAQAKTKSAMLMPKVMKATAKFHGKSAAELKENMITIIMNQIKLDRSGELSDAKSEEFYVDLSAAVILYAQLSGKLINDAQWIEKTIESFDQEAKSRIGEEE